MREIIFYLNELNSAGEMTGETRVATLSDEAIMDIIDSARSLAIQVKAEVGQADIDVALANLHEALDTYGLVTPTDAPKP